MNFKKLLFAAVIVLSANASFAQVDSKVASHTVAINISEVALLDLEFLVSETSKSTAITLAGTAPTEAGEAMTFENAKNDDIWMNYSSILGNEASRSVSVSITDGFVPTGMNLTVKAAAYAGAGAGTMGSVSGSAIILSGSTQDIITTIGSAYTGNGPSAGHKLTYQLVGTTANYAGLDADNSDVLTITYTLSDITL